MINATSSFCEPMPIQPMTRNARPDEIERAVATGAPVPAFLTRAAKRTEILEATR